jgi:LacI family repressor for deo operon, udp, cdd, tsx, nupC, and nupG
MKEFGYVPNPHAQQLVTGRGKMVMLHAADVEVEFMFQMARGTQNTLAAQGYGLLLDTMSGLDQDESLLRDWIASGAVDGTIVITGAPDVGDRVAKLLNPRTPVVAVGYPSLDPAPRAGSVIWNLTTGANQVADMLADFGHRRIGFIDIGRSDPVIEAFRNRLGTHGVALDPDLVVVAQGLFDPEYGAGAMKDLLAKPSPPTAVFVRNDVLAIGALREAKRGGLRVPDDISIVGHDDVPLARYTDPQLTTVRVDCFEMGRISAEMIFNLLDHRDVVLLPQTVDCTSLVMRETAGPVKSPSRRQSGWAARSTRRRSRR